MGGAPAWGRCAMVTRSAGRQRPARRRAGYCPSRHGRGRGGGRAGTRGGAVLRGLAERGRRGGGGDGAEPRDDPDPRVAQHLRGVIGRGRSRSAPGGSAAARGQHLAQRGEGKRARLAARARSAVSMRSARTSSAAASTSGAISGASVAKSRSASSASCARIAAPSSACIPVDARAGGQASTPSTRSRARRASRAAETERSRKRATSERSQ